MDKKGIYINRTRLYRTLRKTPIKREGKKPFLIKKNTTINKVRPENTPKKIRTTARVELPYGRLLNKGVVL